MKTGAFGKTTLVCCALATAGCGGFPELIMDTARDSAKEAIAENVDQVVNQVIDQAVGAIFDEVINELMGSGMVDLPFLDQDAAPEVDDDGIEEEDDGRDTSRPGGRS